MQVDIVSSSGTLSVSDSTAQASLSTIAGDTTSLDTKIVQGYASVASGGSGLVQVLAMGKDQSGNLDPLNVDSQGHLKITINDIESGISNSIPVSDSTAQASLSTIAGAVSGSEMQVDIVSSSGTLAVSDATAQATLSQIETAVETLDDIVSTDGSAYSSGASKGVMLLAKDNSGNFKPVELDASSQLKVASGAASVSQSVTTTHSGVSVANSTTSTSSAVDLNTVKHVSVIGNCAETGTEIEILVSDDDVTYYKKTDISIFSDYSSGDFVKSFDINARYLKVKYVNDSGSSKILTSKIVHKS